MVHICIKYMNCEYSTVKGDPYSSSVELDVDGIMDASYVGGIPGNPAEFWIFYRRIMLQMVKISM